MAKQDKEVFESLELNNTYVYVPVSTKLTKLIKKQYKKNDKWYTLISFLKKDKGGDTMILGYFNVSYGVPNRGPSVAYTPPVNAEPDWTLLAEELARQDQKIEIKHRKK